MSCNWFIYCNCNNCDLQVPLLYVKIECFGWRIIFGQFSHNDPIWLFYWLLSVSIIFIHQLRFQALRGDNESIDTQVKKSWISLYTFIIENWTIVFSLLHTTHLCFVTIVLSSMWLLVCGGVLCNSVTVSEWVNVTIYIYIYVWLYYVRFCLSTLARCVSIIV